MSADKRVVRVRWARGCYVTAPMPHDDAADYAATIAMQVEACGDSWQMFLFDAWHGRIRVRGRDITAVEIHFADQVRGPGGRPGFRAGDTDRPAPLSGTAWLQERADRAPAVR